MHWRDILGPMVSASEVNRMALAANETLAKYIETQSADMYGEGVVEADWDELARQIEREIETDEETK